MSHRLLFVLHQMGTLDHAVALKGQLSAAGGSVEHVVVGGAEIPNWAKEHFPAHEGHPEGEAITQLGSFRAAWVPSPYEGLRPLLWRRLWEKVPLVYSGYGVNLTDWEAGHYELDFYSRCERILTTSSLDTEGRLAAGADRDRLVLGGDPLLSQIVSSSMSEEGPERPDTVLWAPHWTKDWFGKPGFSNWEWAVGALYKFFRQRPSTKLIVRPHPFLDFQKGGFNARRCARAMLALPNVSVSEASMHEDIVRSDILVSDGVTILAYFGVTSKPVVFLRRENVSPPFNPVGVELAAAAQTATSPAELVSLLSQLLGPPGGQSGLEADHMRDVVLRSFLVGHESPGAALLGSL